MQQTALCLEELHYSHFESMKETLEPLVKAIKEPALLQHQDQKVQLFVVSCACEILRIAVPNASYKDEVLKVFILSNTLIKCMICFHFHFTSNV